MKRPLWYRLARLAMLGIREPFYSPAFCLFLGFAMGIVAAILSISGAGREMEGAFSQALVGVVQACQVAGK